METNVENPQVMRISRQPSTVHVTIDQKQLQNMAFLNYKYLGNMVTNGDSTCEIKSRISMKKAEFKKKKKMMMMIKPS